MSPLLLIRLGRGEYADGPSTMYAVIDGSRVADVVPAWNDDEALAQARALAGDRGVECESALQAVAQRRNAPVRPLDPFEQIVKAHIVAPLFVPETYRGGLDAEAMMDFFEAAHVFSRAVGPDSRAQWHIGATLRGTIREQRFDDELFFLVVPGNNEPKLYVLTRERASWVFANDAEVTAVDRKVIDFRATQSDVSAALKDAYGLETVPHVETIVGGARDAPSSITLEYLAACMGSIGRYVAAGAPGIIYSPQLGGSLDIKLGTFQQLPR